MPFIAATARCFPSHYYSQEILIAMLRKYWEGGHSNLGRLERIQLNTSVQGRHLALPIEFYENFSGFAESNRAWITAALDLGQETINQLFETSGLAPEDIDLLAFTTVTGIAVPSIDARLMNRIAFRPDMKRLPLFGLGCLGGAAGVARVADYLQGHPKEAAVLLSVELCSLTIQREDLSIENIVASGLFGDGAAAVLLLGDEHPAVQAGMPAVVDSRSAFFPDTEHVMGWDVRDSGLKVLLSADVSAVAEKELRPAVVSFLEGHDMKIGDMARWVAHPGGPKVIEAMENGLNLPPDALQLTRESLATVGNISSASVLMVLHDTLQSEPPAPGSHGVLMAMGPAFCAELVLLRW